MIAAFFCVLSLMATVGFAAAWKDGNGKSSGGDDPVIVKPYGHACFKISTKDLAMIIDPFNPTQMELGDLTPDGKKVTADYLLISHDHFDHNFKEICDVKRQTFELADFKDSKAVKLTDELTITRLITFHDEKEGKSRGKNIVHVINFKGFRLAHMGDLGHMPGDEFFKQLGNADALMIPCGAGPVIDSKTAIKIINKLKGKVSIIIPMHYRIKDKKKTHYLEDTLDDFITLAKKEINPEPEIARIPYCHCCDHGGLILPAEDEVKAAIEAKKPVIVIFSRCK